MGKIEGLQRPYPPPGLREPGELFHPAPEIFDWFKRAVVDEKGPIHNPEHKHLKFAKVGVLWTNVTEKKGQFYKFGTAEILSFRGKAWQKARARIPFVSWFDNKLDQLDFLITLYAPLLAIADDYSFCSKVEHEFLHCGQALEDDGKTKRWRKDGSPIYALRPHDAEVFVSEVRRYGAGSAAGDTAEVVRVGQLEPEVGPAAMRAACGTCLRLVA